MSLWLALSVGLLGWVLLPGLALSRRAPPPGAGPLHRGEMRLAAAILFGEAIWVLVSGALARLGLLSADAVWIVALLLGVASIVALRAQGPEGRGAQDATVARSARRRAALWLVLALAATLAPRAAAMFATPFRGINTNHWSRTLEVARLGGIPSVSFEWGTTVPFFGEYNGYHAASAVLVDVAGADPLVMLPIARALGAATALVGFWLFVRRWCDSPILAAAAVALFNALGYCAWEFGGYSGMGFAFGLVFTTPLFAAAYLSTGSRFFLAGGALGLAALSQVHGIGFVFCGILVVAEAASQAAASGPEAASARRRLLPLGLALAAAWLAADLAISGRMTQLHMAASVPPPTPDGIDRTWLFARHGQLDGQPPAAWRLAAHALLNLVGHPSFNGSLGPWLGALAVAGVGTVAALRHGTERRVLTMVGVALAFVAGLCVFFTAFWSTFVPQRTGVIRFLSLSLAVVIVFGAATAARFATRRPFRVLAPLFAGAGLWAAASQWHQPPAPADLRELQSLRRHVGGGLVLTNGFAAGLVRAAFGVPGLLGGREPDHITALADRANGLLQDARRFFASPDRTPFDLHAHRVTHVLVARDGELTALYPVFPAAIDALERHPDLEILGRTPRFWLFRVRPAR